MKKLFLIVVSSIVMHDLTSAFKEVKEKEYDKLIEDYLDYGLGSQSVLSPLSDGIKTLRTIFSSSGRSTGEAQFLRLFDDLSDFIDEAKTNPIASATNPESLERYERLAMNVPFLIDKLNNPSETIKLGFERKSRMLFIKALERVIRFCQIRIMAAEDCLSFLNDTSSSPAKVQKVDAGTSSKELIANHDLDLFSDLPVIPNEDLPAISDEDIIAMELPGWDVD